MPYQKIEAVQTFYRGTYYRSRLEARWAVFFDVLGISHEYEPEKFQLSSGRYIPDFELVVPVCGEYMQRTYFEVKGQSPSGEEAARFEEFCKLHVFIKDSCYRAFLAHGGLREYGLREWMDMGPEKWLQCPFCGGFMWRLASDKYPMFEHFSCAARLPYLRAAQIKEFDFELRVPDSPTIRIALNTAVSARFEDRTINLVDTAREEVRILTEEGIFCSPKFMAQLWKGCQEFSLSQAQELAGVQ